MPIFDPNAKFKVYKGDKLIYTNAPSGSFGDALAWFMKNDDGMPESEMDKVKGLKLEAVVASKTAMEAMINSELTMYVVATSKTVMNAVAASKTAMDAVAASKTAMFAVLASRTAMYVVTDSKIAMDAVAASKVAMYVVTNSKTAMDAVAASDTAMDAVAASKTAVDAVLASKTAMDAVLASKTAMDAMLASKTAMDAVAASKTAMDAVAASKTAMDAVAASKTAMETVAASKTAMDAVLNSKTAMDAVIDSDVAIASMVCGSAEVNAAFLRWSYGHHSFSRVYQTVSKSNLFTIIYSNFGDAVFSFNNDYNKKINKKPSNVICFAALSAYCIKDDKYPTLEGYASMTSNGVYMRGYSNKETVRLSKSDVNGIGINIWDIKGERQGRGNMGYVSVTVYQVKNP
ncbi:hypothetical protein CYJ27_02455 [Aerococcus christensenii]|uniref:Uncharacterized protein n=1 Tax=Aerococcus christensenii TaxID=87541 RepID=A0A2I1K7E5_9LACT|nr:hypothetical protein [Aerococcus christensenii]PKY91556.1 hypothetical protein CYJ27_02455 [Aerococcus christensenii]